MDSHTRLLLLAFLGAIGTLIVLKLDKAQTLRDYALVLVVAIFGGLGILILAYVALAISRM